LQQAGACFFTGHAIHILFGAFPKLTLLVLAGSLYLQATRGFRVVDPLERLPIGRRLQRLKGMLAA
jgi:hypothetical protein